MLIDYWKARNTIFIADQEMYGADQLADLLPMEGWLHIIGKAIRPTGVTPSANSRVSSSKWS